MTKINLTSDRASHGSLSLPALKDGASRAILVTRLSNTQEAAADQDRSEAYEEFLRSTNQQLWEGVVRSILDLNHPHDLRLVALEDEIEDLKQRVKTLEILSR